MGSHWEPDWERAVSQLIEDVSPRRPRERIDSVAPRSGESAAAAAPENALDGSRAQKSGISFSLSSGAKLQSQLTLMHRASGETQAKPQAREKRLLDDSFTDRVESSHNRKKVCIKRDPDADDQPEDGEILLPKQLSSGLAPKPKATQRDGFVNARSMQLPASPGTVKPSTLFVHATRKGEDGRLGVDTAGWNVQWYIPQKGSHPSKSYLLKLLHNTSVFWKRAAHRGRLEFDAPLRHVYNAVLGEKPKFGTGDPERWTFQIRLDMVDGLTGVERELLKPMVEHNQQHVFVLLRAILDTISLATPPTAPPAAGNNQPWPTAPGGLRGWGTMARRPGTPANAVASYRGGSRSAGSTGHSTPREATTGPMSAADDMRSKFNPDYLAGYLAAQRGMGYYGDLTGPLSPAVHAFERVAPSLVQQRGTGYPGYMGGIADQQWWGNWSAEQAILGPMSPAAQAWAAAPFGPVGQNNGGHIGDVTDQQWRGGWSAAKSAAGPMLPAAQGLSAAPPDFVAQRSMERMGSMMDQQLPGVWSSADAVPGRGSPYVPTLTASLSDSTKQQSSEQPGDTTGQQPPVVESPVSATPGARQSTQATDENCTVS